MSNASTHRHAALTVLLTINAWWVLACGGQSDVKKVAECPSPGGNWTTVIWAESGGGAAGWFNYVVSIRSRPGPDAVERDGPVSPEETIMRVSNAEGIDFTWQGNDTLIVSGNFPKRASLDLHVGFPLLNPEIRIIYRDLQPVATSALEFPAGKMSCGSGSPSGNTDGPGR